MNCSLRARTRWVVFSHISQALCSFIYSLPQLPGKGLYYVKIILNFCPNNWSVTVSLYHILHNMLSPSWGNVAIIIYTNGRYPTCSHIFQLRNVPEHRLWRSIILARTASRPTIGCAVRIYTTGAAAVRWCDTPHNRNKTKVTGCMGLNGLWDSIVYTPVVFCK